MWLKKYICDNAEYSNKHVITIPGLTEDICRNSCQRVLDFDLGPLLTFVTGSCESMHLH